MAKAPKYDKTTGTGGTKVGGILRTIGTEENIQALITGVIGFASTKLADSASKSGNKQAIAYSQAETERLLAEKASKEAVSPTSPTATTKKKWVVPVAIGGGVLLIGFVLYFAMRKK